MQTTLFLLKNDYKDLKVNHFYITKVFRDPKKCQKFPICISELGQYTWKISDTFLAFLDKLVLLTLNKSLNLCKISFS